MSEADGSARVGGYRRGVSRRAVLRGGALVGAATVGLAGLPRALGAVEGDDRSASVENLGPGNLNLRTMSGRLAGDTFYVGTRNLSPTRVVAFHIPSATVTATYLLGNGNFVQGLAADGAGNLYAGVTHAADTENLYRIALDSGEVSEVTGVPGLYIRDLVMAPDGVLYITGRPRPHADGPPVYSWDPASERLERLGVPDPKADQGTALVATDSTVYYGCGSILTGGGDASDAGVFAIDRATHEATRIALPDPLAADPEIRALALFADLLVVTTIRSEPDSPGNVGLLDVTTGEWRIPDYVGNNLSAVVRRDNRLIFASSGRLDAIDVDTLEVTQLDTGDADVGGAQSMGVLDGVLYGSGSRVIWSYDLNSGAGQAYDLVDAGAEAAAMLGMSVAADDRRVYVAGTGSVDMHDLETGERTRLSVPGEVKDMLTVGTTLYMGVYNSHGIWRYQPGGTPEQVAELPAGQNRPRDICWDEDNELIGLAVKADSSGGGSLCLYDPATDAVTAHVDPLGETQVVNAVAAAHGLVYIGGNKGDVAAWDPVAGEQVWRYELPFTETSQKLTPKVVSLVAHGLRRERLVGTTERSLFAINMDNGPELVHHVNLSAFTGSKTAESPELILVDGMFYAVSALSFVRIDPQDYGLELLIGDLGGEWFGAPHVTADARHRLYTLSGRDLIQVTLD